jgi:Cu+-exporting ATPase
MEVVHDPVCGQKLRWSQAGGVICHDGTLYYFCCRGCLSRFSKNPRRFVLKTAGTTTS